MAVPHGGAEGCGAACRQSPLPSTVCGGAGCSFYFCSLGKAIIKCLGETVCAARREVSKYV